MIHRCFPTMKMSGCFSLDECNWVEVEFLLSMYVILEFAYQADEQKQNKVSRVIEIYTAEWSY